MPGNGFVRQSGNESRRRASDERAADIMRLVLSLAHEDGQTRGLVADRLGVSPHTVEAWCKPSNPVHWPMGVVVELLADPGILGERAWMVLARKLVTPGGLGIFELPEGGEASGESLQMIVLHAVTNTGGIAEHTRSALADGHLDDAELRGVLLQVRSAIETLHGLKADVEARLKGGAA